MNALFTWLKIDFSECTTRTDQYCSETTDIYQPDAVYMQELKYMYVSFTDPIYFSNVFLVLYLAVLL